MTEMSGDDESLASGVEPAVETQEPSYFMFYWALVVCLLLFSPCIFSARRRTLWKRRITLCRWNVNMSDFDSSRDSPLFANHTFRRRYPQGDPRYVASSEEVKRQYVHEKLKDYTKTIVESDFSTNPVSAIEVDENEGSTVVQSSHDNLIDSRHSILSTISAFMSASENVNEKRSDCDDIKLEAEKVIEPEMKAMQLDSNMQHANCGVESQSDIEAGDFAPEAGNTKLPKIDNNAMEDERGNNQKVQTVLQLPNPGIKLSTLGQITSTTDDAGNPVRYVIPECTICLNDFKVGERASWSPQKRCFHGFHEDCIVQWFVTLGRRTGDDNNNTGFEMNCPICREDWNAEST